MQGLYARGCGRRLRSQSRLLGVRDYLAERLISLIKNCVHASDRRAVWRRAKDEAYGILLKLVDSGHVVGFDERAILARTCEFVAASSDVVVALAVGSCSELLKKLQIS